MAELCTVGVEEAAAALPWASAFYLAVVFRPISRAQQLRIICAAARCVFV